MTQRHRGGMVHPNSRLIAAVALASLLLAWGAVAAAEIPPLRITLRPNVELPAGELLLLRQVAEIEGPGADRVADVPLGKVPGPGQRRALSRLSVIRALESAGITGADAVVAGAPRLMVSGKGQALDAERVRGAVEEAVATLVPEGKVKLERLQLPAGLRLPPGDYEVRIGPLPRSLRSGTNRFTVEIIRPDGRRRRVGVYAQLEVIGPMVVAARDVPRGERIRPADLRMEMRSYPSGTPVLRNANDALGKVARSTLRRGKPVREASLQRSHAVENGQTVTAIFRRGGVSLELETEVRGQGEVGSIVRVLGQDGRRLVRARVIAPGRVLVLGSEQE